MARPFLTIQPGMTAEEVTNNLTSYVVRQPANVTFCNLCEKYVLVDHDCAAEAEDGDWTIEAERNYQLDIGNGVQR